MDNNREEQEADEIVRRLKAPPARHLTAGWTMLGIPDLMSDEIAKMISDEIDKELLAELMKELGK